MRNILHILGGLAFLLLPFVSVAQNQFHISQSMMHQPLINPAATVSYNNLNGGLFYKKQWAGLNGAPKILGVSANMPILKNQHMGLTLINDQIGVNDIKDISLSYAYKIKLDRKHFLALGVSAATVIMQSNLAAIETVQSDDPVFAGNSRTYFMPNAKFGAYYFTHKFYAGFAIPNLMKNSIEMSSELGNTSFSLENIHYYMHTGYQFDLIDKWTANASILAKQTSGAPVQLGFNGQVVYDKRFGVGLSYRTSQEITGLVNYTIIPGLKLGYAYDYNLDELGGYSSGTHEIVLLFDYVDRKVIPIIEVPRF